MKILAIGNSFSQDATTFLHQISVAGGKEIEVMNLYIGGCSLETHASNCRDDKNDYELQENGVMTGKPISVKEALVLKSWDYVTFQQVSGKSFDYTTYMPYLRELSDYVKNYASDAEQIIHCTWAYEPQCALLDEVSAGTNEEMYTGLKKAYALAADELGGARIIPSGDAMQSLVRSGKKAHRDTFHALDPQGRYLLGLVWYRFFTGDDVMENSFVPDGMTSDECEYYKKICMDIVK